MLTESTIFDVGQRAPVGQKSGGLKGKQIPEENCYKKGNRNGNQTAPGGQLTNKERRKEGKNDDNKALGNSLAGEQPSEKSSSSIFDEASKSRKRFANYCRSVGGSPTEEGYLKWNGGRGSETDLPDSWQDCIDAMNALRDAEKCAWRLSQGDQGLMVGAARARYMRLKKHREQFQK